MKFIFCFLTINALLFNYLVVNSSFQCSVFNEVNVENKEKNVIVSPLSIFQVLGLTANGGLGLTRFEMVSALEETSLESLNTVNYELIKTIKDFVSVELANGVMSTFEPIKSFIKICDKYEAPIEKLVSVDQVNEWCSKKTNGKITEIIDELDPRTVMLLLNAVYFRGEWVYPFNPDKTYKGTFSSSASSKAKTVEMMTQSHSFMFYEDENIQAIELPYKNDSMSAVIIMPSKDTDIDSFANLNNINELSINNILDGMKQTVVKINLPKFEVGFDMKLKPVLQRLGMVFPFRADADFSGINGSGGLYINEVIHKTYLKVDEIGSEAAAVTIVDMRKTAILPKVEMDVNRPFIFIIKSNDLPKHNNFLFMAKIKDI